MKNINGLTVYYRTHVYRQISDEITKYLRRKKMIAKMIVIAIKNFVIAYNPGVRKLSTQENFKIKGLSLAI